MVADCIATGMKEELTDIQGVGDATAEKILEVVDANSGVSEEVRENVLNAQDYFEEEQYGYAGKFLKRAAEEVE